MPEVRIIKKYPNRRLYDTVISSYITLDEIKELVLNNIPLKVIDARTDEDVTNTILLQIINDQENEHTPIFTTTVLQSIIRFYGNPLQKMMSQFLEKSLDAFTEKPENFQSFNAATEFTKRNIALWQSSVEQLFAKNTDKGTEKPSKKKPAKKHT